MVVAIQAADAQIKAPVLAKVTDTALATSGHPSSGPRPDLDDMLNVLEQVVVPRGQEPCAWQEEAMLALVDAVQSAGNTVLATGDATGLTAELPFQSETSLLTVTTREQHPQLGNGVLVRLQLPVLFPEAEGPGFASELNRRELTHLTRSHFLGSWCWHDEFMQFVSFLPNALHVGGADLFNFLASSYSRAKWVAETIYGDDWQANRDDSGRPLATPAIGEILGDPGTPGQSIAADGEHGEWPSPLNAELFEQGGDAYANVSLELIGQASEGLLPPVPQLAKSMALFLVERTTPETILQRYADSFLEAFGVAFRMTWAEEWEDLDADHALQLVDDGLDRLREEHVRNAVSQPLDVTDPDQRVTFAVMGLVGTHPTFEQGPPVPVLPCVLQTA